MVGLLAAVRAGRGRHRGGDGGKHAGADDGQLYYTRTGTFGTLTGLTP